MGFVVYVHSYGSVKRNLVNKRKRGFYETNRGNTMDDLIRREDAIEALNECEDIKGFAYTQMHEAIMNIPKAGQTNETNSRKHSIQ